MFYLALGYFVSYLPYALLTTALSSGIVPGVDKPIFLGVSGWWRFAREQRVRGRRILLPGRDDHRRTAMVIQQAVRARLAEQFS